eukprot:s433_g3.t1
MSSSQTDATEFPNVACLRLNLHMSSSQTDATEFPNASKTGGAEAPLLNLLPEYGLEPLTSVLKETLALAQKKVATLAGMQFLLDRVTDLQGTGSSSTGHRQDSLRYSLPGLTSWKVLRTANKMVVLTAMIDCSCDESTLLKLLDDMTESTSPESGRHGIFLWVVGSCRDCQATQAWAELLQQLQRWPLPIVGVAMGKLNAAAAELVTACDYIYSDGMVNLGADQVYPSMQMLSLACSTTIGLLDNMATTQLVSLKREMLWAKASKLGLTPKRQSSCSTDVPETPRTTLNNEDFDWHGELSKRSVENEKRLRFAVDVEIIPY